MARVRQPPKGPPTVLKFRLNRRLNTLTEQSPLGVKSDSLFDLSRPSLSSAVVQTKLKELLVAL